MLLLPQNLYQLDTFPWYVYNRINNRFLFQTLKPEKVEEIIALGEQDALKAIQEGEGISFDHLIHYHSLKKNGDQRVEKLTLGQFIEAKKLG